MLVATANWGFGDGSVAAPPPGRLAQLAADVERAAFRAGCRRDGRYRPIERIAVVLAGDTLDGLTSGRWLDAVRPWDRRRQAAAVHEAVLEAAYRGARRPLARLSRLARRGLLVPSADRHGRPVLAARVRVPVHVAILVGDRDAALGRNRDPGPRHRGRPEVGTTWVGRTITVEHAGGCDPLQAGDGGPTLFESLVTDLVVRFGAALVERPGLAEAARRLVRQVVDAALLDAPLHVGRACTRLESGAAGAIESAWRRAVDRWAREARRTGCADGPGVVDALATWMQSLPGGPAPSAAVREVIDALAMPLLPRSRPDGLLVLGHPGAVAAEAETDVVCLGRSPVGACGGPTRLSGDAGGVACFEAAPVAAELAASTVVVLEDDEGTTPAERWWLQEDGRPTAALRPARPAVLDAA